MSKSKWSVAVLSLVVGIVAGLAAGYWRWDYSRTIDTGLHLPTPRSTAVPEGFAMPGLRGRVRDILLEPDTFVRIEALARLFAQLGPESLEDVRDAYDSVLLDLGDTELVLFGEWWARFDPRTALLWTNQNWTTRNSIPVHRGIMREWGRNDPIDALASTVSAPNDVVARRWVDSILRGWDESVIDGALSYATSMAMGPGRQWALYVVTRRRVLRDGPESVIAWAEDLPDRDATFKLNVFRRVASAVAEVDVPLAVAFAERHLDGPYAAGLPERVGMKWVLQDPEAAMTWLSTLPAGRGRDVGVMETYRSWLLYDRRSAQAWVPTVENDGWLDPAVSLYARSISLQDPVAALEWASGIGDPALHDRTVGTIARKWYWRDPDAADAWLEGSGLDETLLRKIRVRRPGGPVLDDEPGIEAAMGSEPGAA